MNEMIIEKGDISLLSRIDLEHHRSFIDSIRGRVGVDLSDKVDNQSEKKIEYLEEYYYNNNDNQQACQKLLDDVFDIAKDKYLGFFKRFQKYLYFVGDDKGEYSLEYPYKPLYVRFIYTYMRLLRYCPNKLTESSIVLTDKELKFLKEIFESNDVIPNVTDDSLSFALTLKQKEDILDYRLRSIFNLIHLALLTADKNAYIFYTVNYWYRECSLEGYTSVLSEDIDSGNTYPLTNIKTLLESVYIPLNEVLK